MIRVTTNLGALARYKARVAVLPTIAGRAAKAGLLELANTAADDVRRSFGREQHASAPGEPPSDPGERLAGAVTVEADPDVAAVQLTVALPFAQDLEFGTHRMAARPFLRPAAARAGQEAARLLGRRLDDALTQDEP